MRTESKHHPLHDAELGHQQVPRGWKQPTYKQEDIRVTGPGTFHSSPWQTAISVDPECQSLGCSRSHRGLGLASAFGVRQAYSGEVLTQTEVSWANAGPPGNREVKEGDEWPIKPRLFILKKENTFPACSLSTIPKSPQTANTASFPGVPKDLERWEGIKQ